jgi:hypothetical protein
MTFKNPLLQHALDLQVLILSHLELLFLAVVATVAAVVVVLPVRADKANPVGHSVLDHAGEHGDLLCGKEGATRRDARRQLRHGDRALCLGDADTGAIAVAVFIPGAGASSATG